MSRPLEQNEPSNITDIARQLVADLIAKYGRARAGEILRAAKERV